MDYIRDNKITDKREQMIKALYYVRHRSYNRFVELIIAQDMGNFLPCDTDYIILDENSFVYYMAGVAKRLDINYDVIVATEEYNGSIDDLLLESNVRYGLRFNFPEPLYFFNLSAHVQADNFPQYLEGTDIYLMNVENDKKLDAITTERLPVTTAADNTSFEKMTIQFSDDFSTMDIDRTLDFTGHFKTQELDNRVFFGDYLNEEFTRYGTAHFYRCKKKQSKYYKDIENKVNASMRTYKERNDEDLEKAVSANFDTKVNDYSHRVTNLGRYSKDALSINDQISLENNYFKKAGPNYIMEIGKLIGGQVQIDEDEVERTHDIYLEFAKTYKFEIDLTIPDGYEVVGLDKLKKSRSNTTGSFKSTAEIQGNTLKLTSKKVYAKRKYAASDWSQMIDWLRVAYDFSQEKIMFRKK